MAKKNDLAALAALGALGFMLKNKSDSDFQENREDQTSRYKPTEDSNPTRGAGYNSTETRVAPEPNRQISNYIAESPKDPRESASEVSGAPSQVFSTVNPSNNRTQFIRANQPKNNDTVVDSGISRSIANNNSVADTTVDNKSNFSNEDYRSESPALKEVNEANGANTRSANRGDQLGGVSRAVKREAKTKQFAEDVPYQESKAKTDALMVASRAARAADAKRRAAKNSAYKKGGVTKMASGGMTSSASRRADGIASKGKTRGKIC